MTVIFFSFFSTDFADVSINTASMLLTTIQVSFYENVYPFPILCIIPHLKIRSC